jgi:hypothetical protein
MLIAELLLKNSTLTQTSSTHFALNFSRTIFWGGCSDQY